MQPVNQDVVDGFEEFDLSGVYGDFKPKYAHISCLSEAMEALWTNRVPKHESWPRVIMGDPKNSKNTEYKKNVDHIEQWDKDKYDVNRTEGDEDIKRGYFWKR